MSIGLTVINWLHSNNASLNFVDDLSNATLASFMVVYYNGVSSFLFQFHMP